MNSIHRPYILGIDPGCTGALAYLEVATSRLIAIHDMPLTPSRLTKSTKRANRTASIKKSIDCYALGLLIEGMSPLTRLAVIEKVHSMPQQGVASTFNFGKAYGEVIGSVASSLIPMVFISPQVWKASLNLTCDKNQSRDLAKKVFPEMAEKFTRVKDDGRAEAALIAYFASRFRKMGE